MKVLAVSGSPRTGGNTEALLDICLAEIAAAGIETRKLLLAGKDIRGCMACLKCKKEQDGKCHGRADDLTPVFDSVYTYDAIVLGTPVYFGAATAEMAAFIARVGYVSRQNGGLLSRKIGSPIVVARRSGHNFTVAQLNYFFTINNMIIPGSRYWPIAFGGSPREVLNDSEGIATVKELGQNIAWILKSLSTT